MSSDVETLVESTDILPSPAEADVSEKSEHKSRRRWVTVAVLLTLSLIGGTMIWGRSGNPYRSAVCGHAIETGRGVVAAYDQFYRERGSDGEGAAAESLVQQFGEFRDLLNQCQPTNVGPGSAARR
jgi:hypothetical protein